MSREAGVGRRASGAGRSDRLRALNVPEREAGVGRRASGVGRSDRLRALNVPELVTVTLDGGGLPALVQRATGNVQRVEVVGEEWRIDDEWWRAPIVRHYYEVVMQGGGRMILFEDLETNEWFAQTP